MIKPLIPLTMLEPGATKNLPKGKHIAEHEDAAALIAVSQAISLKRIADTTEALLAHMKEASDEFKGLIGMAEKESSGSTEQ